MLLLQKLAPGACSALQAKLNASDAGMNQRFEPKWSVTKLAGASLYFCILTSYIHLLTGLFYPAA